MGFFNFIGDVLAAPVQWAGDAIAKTGDILNIGEVENIGEKISDTAKHPVYNQLMSSIGTGGISDVYYGYKKYRNTGDWAAGIDRAIDPGGTVDYGTRKFGEALPNEIRTVAPAIGGLIGSIWGPLGAAAGAGIGSKIAGQDYQQGFKTAGTAAAMSYLGGKAGEAFGGSGTAPTPGANGEYFQVDQSLVPTSDYTGGQYFNVDQSLAPTSDVAGGYWVDPSYAQGDYFNVDTSLAPLNSLPPVPQTLEDVSFLQQIINNPKTTEIAKLLAKQALKMAVQYGIQGLMGNMQTFTPQQAPQINTNYSGIPASQFAGAGMISEPTSYTDPTWRPGITDMNTDPTNPNYATDYSLQKQKEVENKRKMEDITKFNPDAYLANYYA